MRIRAESFVCLLTLSATAQDWPTFRGDNARSGISKTSLRLPLREVWVWRSPHPPQPAWPAPAKRDAYNKIENMASRHAFDRVSYVIVADGGVYFGSSADDQVRCLDAATGEERWTFFTEAPVRFAPTFHRGRVYVGSDDGFAYCLEARTGRLEWKHRPGPRDHRVPGNGRMMSVWPVRSGIVIQDGIAYCTAGLFASEGSFLCALDAAGGRPRWKSERNDLNPQGYLLASAASLYVTTGRGKPMVFDRATGKLEANLGGQGGTFAILDGESLIYGPGKTGQLGEFGGKGRDHIATFQGRRMIVRRGVAFLHTDTQLRRLDRKRYLRLTHERLALVRERDSLRKKVKAIRDGAKKTKRKVSRPEGREVERHEDRLAKIARETARIDGELRTCFVWERPCFLPWELVLAKDHVLAGGTDWIAAYSVTDGEEQWRGRVPGRVCGLAIADGRVYASSDTGHIYCFASE